jgi:hypothetical protein
MWYHPSLDMHNMLYSPEAKITKAETGEGIDYISLYLEQHALL